MYACAGIRFDEVDSEMALLRFVDQFLFQVVEFGTRPAVARDRAQCDRRYVMFGRDVSDVVPVPVPGTPASIVYSPSSVCTV